MRFVVVLQVLTTFKRRLEKCFKWYGRANQAGSSLSKDDEADDDSIDCVEWMQACKECGVIDANVSFSKVRQNYRPDISLVSSI